jgi:uncharacterized membrane protein
MLVFLIHCIATVYMTGLIWFVQIVHYPLHGFVGAQNFKTYQLQHVKLTGPVVAPVMIVEAIGAVLLVANPPQLLPVESVWAGLLLLVVIWGSTALLQVPLHNNLVTGFDSAGHQKLVKSNWIRTISWSLRSVLVLYMLWTVMGGNL